MEFRPWRQSAPSTQHVIQGSDLDVLLAFGKHLQLRPKRFHGGSICDWLVAKLLKIRTKAGGLDALVPNRAQSEFSRTARERNIVLKARQMGITTWIAARFFIATITRRGVLTVLVAHDQSSAEAIFRIVHRFWANLPERLRVGALQTSRANVRQIVFPLLDSEYRVESAADPDAGRGLTIQNLHCSEVARWPGDAVATLASLRATLTPDGEIVLESTPRGAVGSFYNEWQRASETGYAQHFYPWWWEPQYRAEIAHPLTDVSEEERSLKIQHGLDDGQIAYRRQQSAQMLRLARQEYAEDAESCFLRSGECVFDIDAVETRLQELSCASVDHAQLRRFLPPQRSHNYIIGVDPAGGGVDGDYACAQVIDRDSGVQCAELQAHLPPQELAARVAALAREYQDALVAVERNNQGGEVLSCLRNVEKYFNLYESNGQDGFLTTRYTRNLVVAAVANCFGPDLQS